MEVLIGKSSITRPFSMAMLNNQRVNPVSFPTLKEGPKGGHIYAG
jgi:hypothetical protein